MATLLLEDGTHLDDPDAIVAALAPLHLTLHQTPLGEAPDLHRLLSQQALDPDEKAQVLGSLAPQIEALTEGKPHGGHDLVALHADIEGLDALLATFARFHTHAEDEVRYIVDGEGFFGFVLPDKSQAKLRIEAPEYICVPQGVEHWFRLTETRRIKAVRIFMEGDAWEASFTDTVARI